MRVTAGSSLYGTTCKACPKHRERHMSYQALLLLHGLRQTYWEAQDSSTDAGDMCRTTYLHPAGLQPGCAVFMQAAQKTKVR